MDTEDRFRRVEADIDLDAIRQNIQTVQALNAPSMKTLVVVKADAYGHGAVTVAAATQDLADYYGVACIDEAVELRQSGIEKPILILGYTDYTDYDKLLKYDITAAVYSVDMARQMSEYAMQAAGIIESEGDVSENAGSKKVDELDCACVANRKIKVHIKADSGMSRIGFMCDEQGVDEASHILGLPGIDVEGVFTHYAKADYRDKSDARKQYEAFSYFVGELERRGADFKYKHIDNSAGAMEIHSEGFNMMRLGIVIYGLYPSEEIDKSVKITPAMTLKSRIIHIKTLDAGCGVSYGWTYVTDKPTRVATVSVGYADGYPRALSGLGRVIICGRYAPILGRVCMDQIMVDVSDIPEASLRDEVILFGRQYGTDGSIEAEIPVEEVAEPARSFNYEMVCHVSRRVPRVYMRDGKYVAELSYIKRLYGA